MANENNQYIDVPEARNSKEIRDSIKLMGAKWDNFNKAWFYRKDDEQAINNFKTYKHLDLDTIKATNAQKQENNNVSDTQHNDQTNSDRKYIDVPNAQKDANLRNLIKKCGAKWDPQNKAWFYNPNDKLADQMLSQFKEIKTLSQNNAQTPQLSTQKKSFTNSVGNFFKNHFSRKPTAESQQATNTDTVSSQSQLQAPTAPNFDLGSKMKEQKEPRTYLVTDNLYNKEEERTALKNAGAEYDYFNKAWYYRDSNVKDQSVLDQYPKTTLADIRSKKSVKKDQSLDQKQVQQQNKKQTKSRSR